jgi:autotransporter-associated beta strand protein
MLLLLAITNAFAGSATWNLNPTDNEWGIASNWTPSTVPNGPNDTATFGVSNTTDIDLSFSFEDEVNGIVFSAGASPFTITVSSFTSFDYIFTISGTGIINNSGITQNFVANGDVGAETVGVIQFTNSATAGDLTTFTSVGTFGGGLIQFADDSKGDTARIEIFGTGSLDISAHNAPGITIGSVEGDGVVSLGANNLTVGSNNRKTTFSGMIQDSGAGGSLTKVGTGGLFLTNANTYSGGTTISGGKLLVLNRNGSATGSGAVQVDAGGLGGSGIIAGPVTIGAGRGALAALSPGKKCGTGNSQMLEHPHL